MNSDLELGSHVSSVFRGLTPCENDDLAHYDLIFLLFRDWPILFLGAARWIWPLVTHNHEPYWNGWSNRHAVWSVDTGRPHNHGSEMDMGWVHMDYTVLVSVFHVSVWWVGWVLVLASWVGLGWVKKNGPASISVMDHGLYQHTDHGTHLNVLATPPNSNKLMQYW